jgi:hypothetical protein
MPRQFDLFSCLVGIGIGIAVSAAVVTFVLRGPLL